MFFQCKGWNDDWNTKVLTRLKILSPIREKNAQMTHVLPGSSAYHCDTKWTPVWKRYQCRTLFSNSSDGFIISSASVLTTSKWHRMHNFIYFNNIMRWQMYPTCCHLGLHKQLCELRELVLPLVPYRSKRLRHWPTPYLSYKTDVKTSYWTKKIHMQYDWPGWYQ